MFRLSEEWINVVLRLWLILVPWILGVIDATSIANIVIVGRLVPAPAAFEIWQGGLSDEKA